MFTYETDFMLTIPVNDYMAARDYLSKEDLTPNLLKSVHCSDISRVEWILEDECRGVIRVEALQSLSEETLSDISSWIRGQCSDGLGEGFEQQSFAYHEYGGEECWECDKYPECSFDMDCAMSSFDWETNHYELQEVARVSPGDVFATDDALFFQVIRVIGASVLIRPIHRQFISERREGNARLLTYRPCRDEFRANCPLWTYSGCMHGRRFRLGKDKPVIHLDDGTKMALLETEEHEIRM